MPKNSFATRLQYLLKQTNIKNATLAKAVQFDLSYISKWLSGKMLPSEKNIDKVIDNTVECLLQGDCSKLIECYAGDADHLRDTIKSELYNAYESSKPKKEENRFQASQPITEVVEIIDNWSRESQQVLSLVDILALPHENRLVLAGIKNGHFTKKPKNMIQNMVINIASEDNVYDSIFLIHMLTSMSDTHFNLYNNQVASGKIVYCMDERAISAFLIPGNKDCIAVNEMTNGIKIGQSINPFIDQEYLIFRKSSISEMIISRDYIQTLISTNIRWILGHATELLLPQDVFEELTERDDRDTSEYHRLYRLSQSIIESEHSQIMIYESAIANLAVDGIIDFYNRPVSLSPKQVIRCLDYYANLMDKGGRIKLIDEGFSDDFRYITNPCMFLSDSLCYIRLENNRYENNILILNDRTVKKMFDQFFTTVWTDRTDVVTENREQIKRKIQHYKSSAKILLSI